MALKRVYLAALLITVCGVMAATVSQAQPGRRKVIQMSGIVLGEDSVSGLPGVHVYVPKAGRGTTTQPNGFFSMPVLVGDSVVIRSVGYVTRHYIVPDLENEFWTIIVEMSTDETYLPEVVILPFPTEEVFKQAVLALNMPLNENGIDKKNLNSELMALMMQNTPMDGNLNYRYYMNQYNQSVMDRSIVRTNPFLNPFNWARFFRDMKRKKNQKTDDN